MFEKFKTLFYFCKSERATGVVTSFVSRRKSIQSTLRRCRCLGADSRTRLTTTKATCPSQGALFFHHIN